MLKSRMKGDVVSLGFYAAGGSVNSCVKNFPAGFTPIVVDDAGTQKGVAAAATRGYAKTFFLTLMSNSG